MTAKFPWLLSVELLEALEARWRSSGWPGVERLNAGLTDEEVDAATDPLGVRLPTEVRTWWRWRNGISVPDGQPVQGAEMGAGGRWYLPLSVAIRRYTMMRDIAATLAADDVPKGTTQDVWWPPQLFPITVTAAGAVTACNCSVGEEAASPVHAVGLPRRARRAAAASLGTVITWWIMAIDTGAWYYDSEQRRWEYDWQLVDEAQYRAARVAARFR